MSKPTKNIITNRAANMMFKKEGFKAGLVLDGWMVKAIRAGNASVSGALYVRHQNGELFLQGIHIKPLESANSFSTPNPDPSIKLLLNRNEINRIIGAEQRKGYTTTISRLFLEGRLIKAEVWLCKGMKQHDKRNAIKEREAKIDAQRHIKGANH